MKSNVGATDRNVRLPLGVLLVAVGVAVFAGPLELGPVVGVIALVLGAVLVGTGLTRVCLLYRLVGVDTSESR